MRLAGLAMRKLAGRHRLSLLTNTYEHGVDG
jgi:hypothetical protein